jgi:predicted DNA-binding protein with PD1-like motif
LKIVPVERTQHLLLRFHAGDTLPDTLLKQLREQQITGGWLRLTGILADVELSAFSSEIEGPGGTKRIAGPIQAVVLDGSLGVADGGVAVDLRVVLARETDRGLETIAGQLLRARVVGLEGSMTVLEETVVPRGLDRASGVRLFHDDAVVAPTPRAHVEAAPSSPATPPARPSVPVASPSSPSVLPTPIHRAAKPDDESDEGPYPQAGDLAEHFAFGACEVLKSDGDRLHLRMKDGRIREIALEMLKVTPLPPEGGVQRYKLSRRS